MSMSWIECQIDKMETEYKNKYGRDHCSSCCDPNNPDDAEATSDCCGADIHEDTDLCANCMEHCGTAYHCADCGQEVTPKEED